MDLAYTGTYEEHLGWPHNERLAGRRKGVHLGQNVHFELQKTFLSEREKIKVELSCPVCVPFVCWDLFRLIPFFGHLFNNHFNISSILDKFLGNPRRAKID